MASLLGAGWQVGEGSWQLPHLGQLRKSLTPEDALQNVWLTRGDVRGLLELLLGECHLGPGLLEIQAEMLYIGSEGVFFRPHQITFFNAIAEVPLDFSYL